MKTMISKLYAMLSESGNKEEIEFGEDVLIESIEETIKEDNFYSLPLFEIIKIIQKSHVSDYSSLKMLVSKINETKSEESVLILNVIDPEESSFDECIRIISGLKNSPICKRIGELFEKNASLPSKEYEHGINEPRKENEELKKLN